MGISNLPLLAGVWVTDHRPPSGKPRVLVRMSWHRAFPIPYPNDHPVIPNSRTLSELVLFTHAST